MMKTQKWLALSALLLLGGCGIAPAPFTSEPVLGIVTETRKDLMALPKPKERLPVAVYEFRDLTGQHKTNDNFADYSTAVTQGGSALLMEALEAAGGASNWFLVVEREGLRKLLQEREIIDKMRERYLSPGGKPLVQLPPLQSASIIIEGGIIAYDTNVLSGGLGARYLGIGGDVQYRRDVVTVSLRAVNVQTGQVLKTVTAAKTIYSAGLSTGIYRFVSFKKLLEAEAGLTVNEPVQLAVRQAIEKAVYALVMEGSLSNLWAFGDRAEGEVALKRYLEEKKTETSLASIQGTDQQSAANGVPRK